MKGSFIRMDIIPENLTQRTFNFDDLNARPVEQPASELQNIPQKQCIRCRQFKFIDLFPKDTRRGNYCNKCIARPSNPTDIPDGFRRCKECKKVFPATDEFFQKGPSFKCGLDNRCRTCRTELDRIYRSTHREEIREAGRKQYAKDIKHSRAQKHESYIRNRERVKKYCARDDVKERKRLSHARYRAHPDVRERNRARGKIYYSTHKEQAYARSHKRNARKNSVTGYHTAQEIREQYKRQKGKCYYCGTHIEPNKFHRDHIVPLSREGSSNAIYNIVLTCAFCNISKGAKLLHEWTEGGRLC